MSKYSVRPGHHSVPDQFIAGSSILANIERDLQSRFGTVSPDQVIASLQAIIARETNPIMVDIYEQTLGYVQQREAVTDH